MIGFPAEATGVPATVRVPANHYLVLLILHDGGVGAEGTSNQVLNFCSSHLKFNQDISR